MTVELTMQSAIEYLGLSNQYPPKAGSGNYMCPVCGEPAKPRKKKLNINFDKNMFRCPRCDFKGGPHHFWAYFRNMPTSGADWTKEVWKDFQSVADGASPETRSSAEAKHVSNERERLDEDHIDKVYRAFLKKLTLEPRHREDLQRRGLSDAAISSGGYKSIQQKGIECICRELEDEGYRLLGVPGFYKEDGHVTFVSYGAGYLIPCLGVDRKVVSLQLRKEKVEPGGTRYFTISSSGKREGTKGIAHPHFTGGCGKKIIITEGPLKANIIKSFTGIPCIAVLGVNSLNGIEDMLKELKKRGVREIVLAYDMDMMTNQHVLKALRQLENMVVSYGFAYCRLTWDPGTANTEGVFPYKGLDDYLLNKLA